MRQDKLDNFQRTPILISLLLLFLFLSYYIYSAYQLKKEDINKEVNYLLENAIKSAETKALDKMLFDLKGISVLNQDSVTNTLKAKPDISKLIKLDTTIIENQNMGKHTVILANKKMDTFMNQAIQMKVQVKSSTIESDTIINLFGSETFTPNMKDVEKTFMENLSKSKLNINFQISKDSIPNKNAQKGFHEVFSKNYYYINTDQIFFHVIKKIIPEIILALVLFFTVLFTFFTMLSHSRKQKEWYNMKEDFMRNMTHELKTPISTIGVALEAIQNFHSAGDEAIKQEYYRIAESENKKLNNLVDKVLSISQNLDYMNERMENIHLPTLIHEVVESFRWRAEQNGIILQLKAIEMNHNISLNSQNFLLALHNLIDNAIKYTLVSNPIIFVTLSKTNDKLLIIVKDNGQPIENKFQNRIFEKFYRIPQGNIHDIKGHGLGLYIVAHLMKTMNGSVELSTDETGNTFILTLPYHPIQE